MSTAQDHKEFYATYEEGYKLQRKDTRYTSRDVLSNACVQEWVDCKYGTPDLAWASFKWWRYVPADTPSVVHIAYHPETRS